MQKLHKWIQRWRFSKSLLMCLTEADLIFVVIQTKARSKHTNQAIYGHKAAQGVFSRACVRERSPKIPPPATQILAGTREHLLC